MIAPLREPEHRLDANARLLARARKAVAAALLQPHGAAPRPGKNARWQVWLITLWMLAVLATSVGFFQGWWVLVRY